MRCDEVRKLLEETGAGVAPETVRAHLEVCADCRAYAQDWALLSAGFSTLAGEPVPEATLGFGQRLLRRLAQVPGVERARAEFAERVGRRVAFATLFMAVLMLLALGLPSTGPVRGPASTDLMAQTEPTATARGIVFADDSWLNQNTAPVRLNRPAGAPQK